MTDLRKLLAEATKGKWKIQRRKMKKSGGAWAEIGTSFWHGFAKVAIRLDDDTEDSPEGVANVELMAMARNLAAALLKAEEALANIASQKKTDELETEYEAECADFEAGYDVCIDVARATLTEIRKLTGAA